jgi:ATP synthase protein I
MGSDDLEERIAKARALIERNGSVREASASDAESKRSMGVGLRVGSQFVSAIVAGGTLGWLADRWLGTAPFGLLILLLLGFVVGLIGLKKIMSGV